MTRLSSSPKTQAKTGALRVVVVDEEIPYPLNTGKRIRSYHLLSRLAKKHRLRFLCHPNIDSAEFDSAKRHFEAIGIETTIIERKLPTQSVLAGGVGFYLKLALNLASPRPYLVDKHRSRAMMREIERIEQEGSVDVWHCEWTPYAQYFRERRSRPLVISAHNVESLIWKRYHSNEPNFIKRWYIARQWRKFERFERRAFRSATSTVLVSDEDAKLAADQFEARETEVVENGVDLASFSPRRANVVPNRLLFVGSLDWRPNLDGLVQFIERAFPTVLDRVPEAQLHIVGRRPPPWLRQLAARREGIELHADVEDVRPFFNAARLMVVPLRIGGGSRLKILEAAAMQLPVVSTRVGAEGLEFVPGRHFVCVESVDEMASPIVDALVRPAESDRMAELALDLVRDKYDWDAIAKKLDDVWRRAAESSQVN